MRRRDFIAILAQVGTLAVLPACLPKITTRGETLAAPRLDAHAHFFSPSLVERARTLIDDPELRAAFRPIDAQSVISELDRTGVARALMLSTAYINASDLGSRLERKPATDEYRYVQEDNDFTAAQAALAPARLIPFASVNPKRDYAIDEFKRCLDDRSMRGLKVHFGNSDVRLREPEHLQMVYALFSHAAERNVPVVAHIHNGELEGFGGAEIDVLVAKVIEPLPTLKLSIAHLGWGGGADIQARQAFAALIGAMERRSHLWSRVWVDCSGILLTRAFSQLAATSNADLAQLSTLLKALPANRLLWGSDTVPDALNQARRLWPLTGDEWETMARSDGESLLG